MDQRSRRWRFRISTLMLLVIIAALLLELWRRDVDHHIRTQVKLRAQLQQAEADAVRAKLEAAAAEAEAQAAMQQARQVVEMVHEGQAADNGSSRPR